jgi:putative peptidoglycan lipid II flippase
MAFWARKQHMGLAAVILAASVLLSRVMGLVRDKIISYCVGATTETDLYFAAFVIPDFMNYLLAGAYFSITLIPLLNELTQRDDRDAWDFFSTVVTWVGLAMTVLTAIGVVAAPLLARWTAPGMTPEDWERLTLFLRIVLPAQIFFLLGSCFTAVLIMHKQFIVPGLTPLVYNLGIIVGGLAMRDHGMAGYCWGVLGGSFLGNFLLPCLAVWHTRRPRLRIRFRHPALRRFLWLALPLMAGQSIVVLDEQLVRVFGSYAGPGAVSWLNYARRLMLVPVGVVAQAAGVASFPFLAELFARRDEERFHATVNLALRNTLAVLIPLSAWMAVAAGPTVTLIFQQGEFRSADTATTARCLQILLACVFCWGVHQILARALYARQNTLAPVGIGSVMTGVAIPMYYAGGRWLGATGVAAASALAIAVYTAILSGWWVHRHGTTAFRGMGREMATVCAVTAAAAAVAYALGQLLLRIPVPGIVAAAAAVAGSGAGFLAVFVPLALRFIPDRLSPIRIRVASVLRRVARRS